MSDNIWQIARKVVWATSEQDASAAKSQLWQVVAYDPQMYHHAIWQACIEKADYLHWECSQRHQHGQSFTLM